MLEKYLDKFCKEFALTKPNLNEEKIYLLKLAEQSLAIQDLDPGIGIFSKICEIPQKKREELFIYLMRANLLGQGTGKTRIGIDEDEKFLTLSIGLPYELDYQTFRETIEDFVNYVIYWQDEVTKFENEQSAY